MSIRDQALEQYIDGASVLVGIEVRPEWRDAVKANLELSLAYWALLREVELPEETEPAAIFSAFDDEGGQ